MQTQIMKPINKPTAKLDGKYVHVEYIPPVLNLLHFSGKRIIYDTISPILFEKLLYENLYT